ncbi:hypothetical protein PLICRDRAFT_41337 [Plicaturopsis crispa FD-325 SS-3]|nr:hypothetical protein PLICRDRAFT_41337 [Plicaturopsis crispa FD-325 SS-3]
MTAWFSLHAALCVVAYPHARSRVQALRGLRCANDSALRRSSHALAPNAPVIMAWDRIP